MDNQSLHTSDGVIFIEWQESIIIIDYYIYVYNNLLLCFKKIYFLERRIKLKTMIRGLEIKMEKVTYK